MLLEVAARTAEKSFEVSLNLSLKQLFLPPPSHYLCRLRFFFRDENFLQSLCVLSGAPSESLCSLAEFRSSINICHICDLVFATFVISYLPPRRQIPPPGKFPENVYLPLKMCQSSPR